MKHIIFLLLLLFCISIGYSQNTYKKYSKKHLKKIILNVDNDTISNEVSFSDYIAKSDLKFTLTGTYFGNHFTKIKMVIDSKTNIINESYYFDEQEYLIYYIIEKRKHFIPISVFEVKFYSKDNILFLLDGSRLKFNKEESDSVIHQIKDDLDLYKHQLTR